MARFGNERGPRLSRLRLGGVSVGMLSLIGAACGGGGGSSSGGGGLASSQVLKFAVLQDPHTWDPQLINAEVDSELMQNVFDQLWRFDDKLTIIPDIATDVPTTANGGISADGKTVTVHLNPNATFSNGDKVTSKDVVYSFNRGVAYHGPYNADLGAIDGFDAVKKAGKDFCKAAADNTACRTGLEQKLAANDPAFVMKGLTAPDPATVKIVLVNSCGWCLAAWSLQANVGSIVDEKVVQTDPVNWWSKPETQVGTGAFKLSAYTPKQSMVFKQVPNWWGSPKPTLTELDLDIKDPSTQSTIVAAWEQGSYDLYGYGGNSTPPTADTLRIKATSNENSQLTILPKGRTTYVSLNVGYPATGGPFLGESAAAKGLRLAFALAVDKKGLATSVCHDLVCAPATGGVITKGLIGYGGDDSDPLGKFDAAKAKSLLQQYDPDGSKTANLKYSYNTGGLNDPVATYLQGQWQTNLGISVQLDAHPDASAFIADRTVGKYVMSRDGWQFDYNHPQDWFDYNWGATSVGGNSSGYGDPTGDPQPTYDSTLATADGQPLDQALPLYNKLTQMLEADVPIIPLYYAVGQFLIHPYVKGAGSNAQADFYWDEISIQAH